MPSLLRRREQEKRRDERLTPHEILTIYNKWAEISKRPNEWLQDLSGEVAFTAGGGLVTLLGDENSEVWQAVKESSKNGMFEMAGITFSTHGLQLMGDFYRFIQDQGVVFQCVDERLENILASKQHRTEVHCHCGACAALHASVKDVTDIADMEAHVQAELGQSQLKKQDIYNTMPNHDTVSILVDFHGDDAVVNEQKRAQLRAIHALPFHASLPVQQIEAFIKAKKLKRGQEDLLLKTLVQWNVQIPRNIIGGGHNDLQQHANSTLLITDKREIKGFGRNSLIKKLDRHIQSTVQFGKRIDIK